MPKLRSVCAVPVLVFWVSLLGSAQEPPLQVTQGLHREVYDYLTAIARADWSERDARIAAIHTPAEVEQRQAFIRSKITELLGGFPACTPLNAKITGGFSRDGNRVETLVFESRPKFYLTTDVYVPTSAKPPFPAVVGVAGHTQTSKAAAFYQYGWISLAKRGFLVIAFDPPGQGERIQYYDPNWAAREWGPPPRNTPPWACNVSLPGVTSLITSSGNDTHGWSLPRREATYRWFQKWVNHRPHDEGVEASFDVEPASRLNATTTGQLQTSLGGETVQSLNAALGARLAKERPTLAGDALRRAIASRIGIPVDRKPHVPKVARFGEIRRDGHRIVKITLETEPGIQVPALAFEPFSATARKPAVLYLDSEGKSAGASPGGYIEALVHSGYVVLAPDLRGWGETAALGGSFPHDGRYHLSMHAMLVGRTVVGMQATDLLAAFDYLASLPDVDSNRIGVFSKGNAEVVALLAASLEPRIHQIACEGGPVSYLDIVRARFHGEIADIAIPGVLQQFDLPAVAAAIGPRKLWLVDPTMPSGSPELLGKVTPEY